MGSRSEARQRLRTRNFSQGSVGHLEGQHVFCSFRCHSITSLSNDCWYICPCYTFFTCLIAFRRQSENQSNEKNPPKFNTLFYFISYVRKMCLDVFIYLFKFNHRTWICVQSPPHKYWCEVVSNELINQLINHNKIIQKHTPSFWSISHIPVKLCPDSCQTFKAGLGFLAEQW